MFGKQYKVTSSAALNHMMIVILAVYFTGICHFTLLHRDMTAGMRYELSLFWSYRYTVENDSIEYFREVVYNIILLLPMGILMPMYLKPFQKWKMTVAVGFLLSAAIETSQLMFHIGLFEFDDMFNNTLGACMGYSVYYLFACMIKKEKERRWKRKLGILLVADVCVILYFGEMWNWIE
ncbi:MAG: VanZ family protein [Hespellia sp.]|nr:VanZ family protein [Hespellia sp.]